MIIRKAKIEDENEILNLLKQVHKVHYDKRPDIFKASTTKYSHNELEEIFQNENLPVFVCEIENKVRGYVFCQFVVVKNNILLCDMKSLYIDDLCVDEKYRKCGIGTKLYEFVKNFAKQNDCYRVILNVWELNDSAKAFYENLGMTRLKTTMEEIL